MAAANMFPKKRHTSLNGASQGFATTGTAVFKAAGLVQAGQKGVLIRRIEPTAPANKSLKKGDILLSFDGVDIANDGTVPFRSGERISFNYLVSKKYTSETVRMQYSHACPALPCPAMLLVCLPPPRLAELCIGRRHLRPHTLTARHRQNKNGVANACQQGATISAAGGQYAICGGQYAVCGG